MIQLDQAHAIPKYMAPLKKFWDDDKLAMPTRMAVRRIR